MKKELEGKNLLTGVNYSKLMQEFEKTNHISSKGLTSRIKRLEGGVELRTGIKIPDTGNRGTHFIELPDTDIHLGIQGLYNAVKYAIMLSYYFEHGVSLFRNMICMDHKCRQEIVTVYNSNEISVSIEDGPFKKVRYIQEF